MSQSRGCGTEPEQTGRCEPPGTRQVPAEASAANAAGTARRAVPTQKPQACFQPPFVRNPSPVFRSRARFRKGIDLTPWRVVLLVLFVAGHAHAREVDFVAEIQPLFA